MGTSPAALLRRGLSPAAVARLEREWERWDAEFGFAFRVAAGITPSSEHGDDSAVGEPPDPPGFGLVG